MSDLPFPYMIPGASSYINATLNEEGIIASLSSMDSDLEAFSRNPTDDSFAPLAFQPRAMTKDPNQRFLSYWVELLLRD